MRINFSKSLATVTLSLSMLPMLPMLARAQNTTQDSLKLGLQRLEDGAKKILTIPSLPDNNEFIVVHVTDAQITYVADFSFMEFKPTSIADFNTFLIKGYNYVGWGSQDASDPPPERFLIMTTDPTATQGTEPVPCLYFPGKPFVSLDYSGITYDNNLITGLFNEFKLTSKTNLVVAQFETAAYNFAAANKISQASCWEFPIIRNSQYNPYSYPYPPMLAK